MIQNKSAAGECCFESPCPAINPFDADNIVVAGGVGTEGCTFEDETDGCALAMVYFPVQAYRAGYCPAEALKKGTLFPELVSHYASRGCC